MINAVYQKGNNREVIFSWICSLTMSSCLRFDSVLPKGQLTSVHTERDKEIISVLKPKLQVSISASLISHFPGPDSCLLPPKLPSPISPSSPVHITEITSLLWPAPREVLFFSRSIDLSPVTGLVSILSVNAELVEEARLGASRKSPVLCLVGCPSSLYHFVVSVTFPWACSSPWHCYSSLLSRQPWLGSNTQLIAQPAYSPSASFPCLLRSLSLEHGMQLFLRVVIKGHT